MPFIENNLFFENSSLCCIGIVLVDVELKNSLFLEKNSLFLKNCLEKRILSRNSLFLRNWLFSTKRLFLRNRLFSRNKLLRKLRTADAGLFSSRGSSSNGVLESEGIAHAAYKGTPDVHCSCLQYGCSQIMFM
jgi:hypothetical protein